MSTVTPETKMLRVFKSRIPSCKFIFKNGKEANFVGGEFLTDVETEISELEHEVNHAHPHIYIDEDKREVSSVQVDPLEEIKRKAIEEYKAQMAAAGSLDNDRGTTDSSKLTGIATTTSVAEGAADSSSGGVNTGSIKVGLRS